MDSENKNGQFELPDEVYKALARVLYPRIRDYYNHLQSDGNDHKLNDSEQNEQSPAGT